MVFKQTPFFYYKLRHKFYWENNCEKPKKKQQNSNKNLLRCIIDKRDHDWYRLIESKDSG